MTTANQMQINILKSNIQFIESLFGEMDAKERTEYMIEWVKIHGKTFRKIYDRMFSMKFLVSFMVTGCVRRTFGVMSKPELCDLLDDLNELNSISIIKVVNRLE